MENAMTVSQINHRATWARTAVAIAVLAATVCAGFASSASAAVEWTSLVYQAPTRLPLSTPGSTPPDGRGMLRILPANAGDTTTTWPTVSFTLPEGVTLADPPPNNQWSCVGDAAIPQTVTCNNFFAQFPPEFVPILPYQFLGVGGGVLPLHVVVSVAPDAPVGTFPFPVTVSNGDDTTTTTHELSVGGPPLGFGPTPGTFQMSAVDQAGDDYTQAGGHPYEFTTSFDLNTRFVEPTDDTSYGKAIQGEGGIRDVVVDLPPGLVGDPSATPKCPSLRFIEESRCPPSTQVGIASVSPPVGSSYTLGAFGVYNVEPATDAPAQFAFLSPVGVIMITPVLRSDGNWGITAHVRNLSQADVILESDVTLWGVPADPSHDAQRCAYPNRVVMACVGVGENGLPPTSTLPSDAFVPHSAGVALRPFMSNPTRCSGSPLAGLGHFSQHGPPAAFDAEGDPIVTDPSWVNVEALLPPVTGCEKLAFDPSIFAKPTNSAPEAPTGLDVEMRLPQNDAPDGLSTAHLRNATVTLPEGMTVNPSSADGLDACTSAQIGLVSKSPLRFTKLEPSCSQRSKIGTVEIDTPLLEQPLRGDVYLARQADNPFNSLLAMYIVARGPGLMLKLAGHIQADPQTGRLSTSFVDNPEVPFSSLKVNLEGGPRAPLTSPARCGSYVVNAALTSWAGQAKIASDSFSVDCPGNADLFDPGFSAGSSRLVAGAYSPFSVRVTRSAGKEIGRIDVKMPTGVLANLRNVAVCSEAQLASATPDKPGVATQAASACPLASQVGTTTVGAGSGPMPFFARMPGSNVSGRVFLTGPHTKTQASVPGTFQADYGLAIEVPVVAGPFDLGTVLVRAAIFVDPSTAQLHVVSDELPRILEGIVLDLRDLRVDVDRVNFATTPTSCAVKKAVADIRAQDGTLAVRSSRYQTGECAALRWNPRLAMRWIGRKRTKSGGHPGIKAVLRQSGLGEAGIKRAKVALPGSLALDPNNAQALCSFEEGTKPDLDKRCPKGSIVGRAKATSPLLKRPLTGRVFFVKNVRIDKRTGNAIRTLPMIIAALRGEVDVNLRGTSSVDKNGHLVNMFAKVPDAPISRFELRLSGGKHGILVVTENASGKIDACRGRQVAQARFSAQNGRRSSFGVRLKTPCKSANRR